MLFQITEGIVCQFVFDIYVAVHIIVVGFAVDFDGQFVIVQICQQTGFGIVIFGCGIKLCYFVIGVEINGNAEVIAVVQCAVNTGRCGGFIIQIYLHIVCHGISFFFGAVFDSDLVGSHVYQVKGLFRANAVDGFCYSDGLDIAVGIGQGNAVTSADFGEVDFFAVIVCFGGAFFTEQIQTSTSVGFYTAEQVAVFQYGNIDNGTGYRAVGGCFRFGSGAASAATAAAAGEQFICFYRKDCHFRTVDVYFWIEVVVIIAHHDVFVIE